MAFGVGVGSSQKGMVALPLPLPVPSRRVAPQSLIPSPFAAFPQPCHPRTPSFLAIPDRYSLGPPPLKHYFLPLLTVCPSACIPSCPSDLGICVCFARPLSHVPFPLLRLALTKWCPVLPFAAHLPHFRRVISLHVGQGGDVLPFSTSYYDTPTVRIITTSGVYSQVGCRAANLRGSVDTSSPWTRWIPVPPPRGNIACSL
jgi:hypothetical protein